MKKPFLHALAAAGYIVLIVLAMNWASSAIPDDESIVAPMVMLSLLVLSAAIMGFLFFFEPIRLYMENQKREAVVFFGKTLGFFAGFIALFMIAFFLTAPLK